MEWDRSSAIQTRESIVYIKNNNLSALYMEPIKIRADRELRMKKEEESYLNLCRKISYRPK